MNTHDATGSIAEYAATLESAAAAGLGDLIKCDVPGAATWAQAVEGWGGNDYP